MAEKIVPYVTAYGGITRALEKIQAASTPDRFTQDFLATKLGLRGGSYKPIIPFLKRVGFLGGDGVPTDLYKRFKNVSLRGAASASALKSGFEALYEVNEYVHDLNDTDLRGVVLQVTGLDAGSTTVKSILGSFKALRAFADFDAAKGMAQQEEKGASSNNEGVDPNVGKPKETRRTVDLKLGYTINLNLPATSDIAVFNAIFKSLREHLMD